MQQHKNSSFSLTLMFGIQAAVGIPKHAIADEVWKLVNNNEFTARSQSSAKRWVKPQRFQAVELNAASLNTLLRSVPNESVGNAARESGTVITLPTPNGKFEKFNIVQSPVMADQLMQWFVAHGYPMVTYRGVSVDNPATSVRLDWGGPGGFHAQVARPEDTYFIDPAWSGDNKNYVSYFKRDYPRPSQWSCGVSSDDSHSTDPQPRLGASTNGDLRVYRTVVAATGEYTAFHDANSAAEPVVDAQAAIVTTINRVNTVYERDLALRLVLVGNNNEVIYTDPDTDPYTNDDGGAMLDENQTEVDNVIGNANYDLGHVVSTGGGGIAGLGVTCNGALKALGVTGSPQPVGDPFDIDYVAHEMGHQLGGNHTFNSENNACGGGNRSADTAYEPGSGSTIMAYAGICEPDNLQLNSDAYLHGKSLDEMLDHLAVDGNCWTVNSSPNLSAPTVNAGANYIIPINTPFELTGSNGDDADGDTLTYTWEEFDLGAAQSLSQSDNGASPLFRSWPPSTNPVRVFPRLQNLLAGTVPTGERLPTTSRTMNFRLTVRDNVSGGQIGEDTMTVTSDTVAGPFQLTAPNGGQSYTAGASIVVTWDVANTASGNVKTPNVNILLSKDGGVTYPHTLATATPNDGSQSVILPAGLTGTTNRIKVKGTNNIFFDVSNGNFAIVANAGKPDFVITNIVLNPAISNISGTFSAAVTVKNQGNLTGNGGYLDVWANQSQTQVCGAEGNQWQAVGSLAAGAVKTLTFVGLPAGNRIGNKMVRAYVDSWCNAVESNETNNQRIFVYAVNAPNSTVDLTVTGITLTPATPMVNGTFNVEVTVKNQGTTNIANGGNLDIWTHQPNAQVCGAVGTKRQGIGSLAAGISKTLNFIGLVAGAAGSKTIRTYVDSGCGVAENNEANNQMIKTYTVQ